MKYIAYYFFIVITVIVILPLIIVKSCGGVHKDILDSTKGKNIKVYFHKTKEIKEMGFEDYIRGVVAAEMPASYSSEALKAQAVAARTYAYNKIVNNRGKDEIHPGADVCTDSAHCQAWISKDDAFKNWPQSNRNINWDKISWAVKSTAGEMIYYEGNIANPVFHANSGGRTENAENVWEGQKVPYLVAVDSPGEENTANYTSQVEVTVNQMEDKIKKEFPDFKIDKKNLSKSIKLEGYTEGGRVRQIVIGNLTLKGTDVRRLLGLKSANFSIQVSGSKINFKVKGFGHGVGMSQCGANCMAQKGKTYKDILKYYYRGVEIKKVINLKNEG